ncbi:hypothetical protein BDA96_01G402800 [Sorghum bicolor]|uniref:Uncharacterized protein n=2 Tax=Sorghum bicolor TaxID=4558 RepID=A0A921V076_SORBI|nr:hypothetical protein BDA96_01G402800 [Sorghum bicolor]OQU92636.1 hypothetical protein SORBI_3001G378550 [Sorghum bicolor]
MENRRDRRTGCVGERRRGHGAEQRTGFGKENGVLNLFHSDFAGRAGLGRKAPSVWEGERRPDACRAPDVRALE